MLKQAKTGPSKRWYWARCCSRWDGRGRARNGGERSRFAGCGEGATAEVVAAGTAIAAAEETTAAGGVMTAAAAAAGIMAATGVAGAVMTAAAARRR